jgi:anti-sigma factor RsiW
MNCAEVESCAIDLVEGKLTEAEAGDLESHLRRCVRCNSIVTRLAKLAREASLAEHSGLSPEFWPRLRRRLEAHDGSRAAGNRRLAAWRRRLRPALASACLLLGTWTGIHLGQAFALREFSPADDTHTSSDPGAPVFDSVILETLPPGSLSGLLVLDLRKLEPGRPER